MNFFIVEDALPLRMELAHQLNAIPGAAVVGHAATSQEAIRGVADTRPDVVTLDLALAEGTGVEVLAAVRGVYPNMTVIVLTNNADSLFRARCSAAGAHYFFDKSTEFDDALALCRSLVRLRAGSRTPK
jgi:two-component system, NarL family, response regulator DevR